MADALEERRRERDRLVERARTYVEELSKRLPVVAAAVAGSVARGDFNVWSDVDVVVIVEDLPERAPERAALLAQGIPPGLQPIGFTPQEFVAAGHRGNRLVREATEHGIVLRDGAFFHAEG